MSDSNCFKNVSLKMSHKMSQSVLASLEPQKKLTIFGNLYHPKIIGFVLLPSDGSNFQLELLPGRFMTTPRCTHELPSAADGIEKRRLKQCWNLSSTHTADRFDRDMIPQLLPFRHAAFQITKWRAPS